MVRLKAWVLAVIALAINQLQPYFVMVLTVNSKAGILSFQYTCKPPN